MFYKVKLCTDKKYADIRRELSDALSEWKKIEFGRFCEMTCAKQDICSSGSSNRIKRQAFVQDNISIKSSFISESITVSISCCDNSDIKKGFLLLIYYYYLLLKKFIFLLF
jgi:hypothetical protein